MNAARKRIIGQIVTENTIADINKYFNSLYNLWREKNFCTIGVVDEAAYDSTLSPKKALAPRGEASVIEEIEKDKGNTVILLVTNAYDKNQCNDSNSSSEHIQNNEFDSSSKHFQNNNFDFSSEQNQSIENESLIDQNNLNLRKKLQKIIKELENKFPNEMISEDDYSKFQELNKNLEKNLSEIIKFLNNGENIENFVEFNDTEDVPHDNTILSNNYLFCTFLNHSRNKATLSSHWVDSNNNIDRKMAQNTQPLQVSHSKGITNDIFFEYSKLVLQWRDENLGINKPMILVMDNAKPHHSK